ncbi:MAG: DUF4252 domain-containing protein [bacterium]
MKRRFTICPARSVVIFALMCVFGTLVWGTVWAAPAASEKDFSKMPGYVDFEAMKIFGDAEATVEVFLKGSLLTLAREAVADEDPELKQMLDNIQYIHVQVFELDDVDIDQVVDKTKTLAKQLENKGWEIAVRVREDEEHVYVYLLPGEKNDISGLVVMVVDEDDEATFVNIVGNIDPANIGRIGRAFHMDSIDIDFENSDVDHSADKDKRDKRTNRR